MVAASHFLKIGPTLASVSFIFGLFKQTIQFLHRINVKNVISIQYTTPGFNSTTSQYESSSITTRPGPGPPEGRVSYVMTLEMTTTNFEDKLYL